MGACYLLLVVALMLSACTSEGQASAHDPVIVEDEQVTLVFERQDDGTGGYTMDVVIHNRSQDVMRDWTLTFRLPSRIMHVWGAEVRHVGERYTVSPADWNRVIQPGTARGFGFSGAYVGHFDMPSEIVFNGRRIDPEEPEPAPPPGPAPDPDPAPEPIGGSWTVADGEIYRNGEMVRLHGLNWFGLETTDRAPHGLWTGRTMESFLQQMAELGFNALRIPVSPESLNPGYTPSSWALEYGSDGREVLETLLSTTAEAGFYLMLGFHSHDAGTHLTGRPYGGDYTREDWLRDVRVMAALAREYPHVFGVDLYNEPHELSWQEWRAYAAEAGQVVLAENSDVLVVVEGVGDASDNGGFNAYWGANLVEAGAIPGIPRDKLLYSPHTYGPSVYWQPYFDHPDFPANMPEVWDTHFGHLVDRGYTLALGEFGGRYIGSDRVWQDAFVDYLLAKPIPNFFYWALNPNSGDTGGLLDDDWRTVNEDKLELLRRLMD